MCTVVVVMSKRKILNSAARAGCRGPRRKFCKPTRWGGDTRSHCKKEIMTIPTSGIPMKARYREQEGGAEQEPTGKGLSAADLAARRRSTARWRRTQNPAPPGWSARSAVPAEQPERRFALRLFLFSLGQGTRGPVGCWPPGRPRSALSPRGWPTPHSTFWVISELQVSCIVFIPCAGVMAPVMICSHTVLISFSTAPALGTPTISVE